MTSAPDVPDRGRLSTEAAHPLSADLDRLDVQAAVDLFARADRAALEAVAAERTAIAQAVRIVLERLRRGGRLFYVGAGTSGRLGALDAAECPPTFHSEPSQVQAIVAGGDEACLRSVEHAEDDREAAREALAGRDVGEADAVIGITAGGTTPFVLAALAAARGRSAATILLACVGADEVPAPPVDHQIRLRTGPELVAGSTRLKAGTATKLTLNTISTLVMVGLGKVHGNLMVDVDARANQKLADRGERLVMHLAAVGRTQARELLAAAGGRVKLAVVMARLDLRAAEAAGRLERAGGSLRQALE